MNRQGKFATLLILILYFFASMWGLYVVYTEFLTAGVDTKTGLAVGDYQGAMIAAYGRADANRFFLRQAAPLAIADAGKDLYEQPLTVLKPSEGDSSVTCDTYTYPILPACLDSPLKNLFANAIRDHLSSYLRLGSLNVPYEVSVQEESDTQLVTVLHSDQIEEPILYGLRGEDADAIANELEGEGVTQGLTWPMSGTDYVTSCYGPRNLQGASSNYHHGIDIRDLGEVLAAADGVVINNPQTSTEGSVFIEHADGLMTAYIHLDKSSITVHEGDTVKRSQVLGSPRQDYPGGPHLHFETSVRDVPGQSTHTKERPSYAGWTTVNPLCLFSEEIRNDIKKEQHYDTTDDACVRQGKDAPSAWCDEYGFTLTQSQAYQPGTSLGNGDDGDLETTEEPATGEDAARPDNTQLTNEQQQKFAKTEQNRYKFHWDESVISASTKYDVDQALILGVITQESLGDPLAISPTGCAGIMQICYGTGENLPGLGAARMTNCGCAGKGPDCACTRENDYRLHADVAIPAGTYLLKENLRRFSHYTDQVAFAVGAYNIGPGIIQQAINGVGIDPSWKQVADYLEDHPDIVDKIRWYRTRSLEEKRAKIQEVNTYVPAVLAYTAAWNGGEPLVLHSGRVETGEVKYIGTYTYDADFLLKTTNTLTPYKTLIETIKTILDRCANDADSTQCLSTYATQEQWQEQCEDEKVQYFIDLYESLRDCAENKQVACQCALPPPPQLSTQDQLLFSINARERNAQLKGYERLFFTQLSDKNIRLKTDQGPVVPASLDVTLTKDGVTLSYKEQGISDQDTETVTWSPGWVVEKRKDTIVFQETASELPQCAPVKTHYAYCAVLVPDEPAARFAITLQDEKPPLPPTQFFLEGTKMKFTPSTSTDVAFYNIYTTQSRFEPDAQVFKHFDATSYLGKTVFVTAVDKAGNEGEAVMVNVPTGQEGKT